MQYADLLLQIIDVSDPNWPSHIKIVAEILDELGIDKEMLYVFNKSDKVDDLEKVRLQLEPYKPHPLLSTLTKQGIAPITEFLSRWQPTTERVSSPGN